MSNLFGSNFMDFMVYKDIREKREYEESNINHMDNDEYIPTYRQSSLSNGFMSETNELLHKYEGIQVFSRYKSITDVLETEEEDTTDVFETEYDEYEDY